MSKTYVVPEEIASLNSVEAKLKHLQNIKGSFSVYRVDCGSCNGCEIEIFAAITPMWDLKDLVLNLLPVQNMQIS